MRVAEARHFLEQGWRPLPATHSIPRSIFQPIIMQTRAPYEGEPRLEQRPLAEPEEQHWFPLWVDALVELWAGPIAIVGVRAFDQRNEVMRQVRASIELRQRIADARREDLRAVREVIRPLVKGPMPLLIEEAEAAGNFG